MSQEFDKENDYTLRERVSFGVVNAGGECLTRIFNFQSAQVTTLYHAWFSSGGAALTGQMKIENFSDIESHGEIIMMHEKLRELGGNPPGLVDTLPKGSASLTRELNVKKIRIGGK